MYFVDNEYGNEPTKIRSTTGFYFIFSEGEVVYRSKTQSINALSSLETYLIAVVTDEN